MSEPGKKAENNNNNPPKKADSKNNQTEKEKKDEKPEEKAKQPEKPEENEQEKKDKEKQEEEKKEQENEGSQIHMSLLDKVFEATNLAENPNWYEQKEYIIFKNQLHALKRNNIYILKESKENKRLLDLKYDDLNNKINMIQTSVIFFSTISGFMQSTKEYFSTDNSVVTVTSITISTYISLILSISKFFKFDEQKERIHNLREKYANLHNKIEYRMDVLGPWTWKELWEHQDPKEKLEQWKMVVEDMDSEYTALIETKQNLCTEYEIIMDSKSRNQYHIKNRELNYGNRVKINDWDKKEAMLEKDIEAQQKELPPPNKRHSIMLPNEDLDNWDDEL
jgi:hypothetical protein